jgi:hypothetical protein
VHGCGSSFTASSDAGAADAQGGDASGEAGAKPCIVPPSNVGNEGDFCALYADKASACQQCDSCTAQDENDCVALGDTLSTTFKSALLQCRDALGCNDLTQVGTNPCVRGQLAMAQPDAAEQMVESTFCNACPGSACSKFFDFAADAGTDAGLGIWALLLDDTLDQELVNVCSNASHCDSISYGICAGLVLCGAAPHSHCVGGTCH